VLVLCPDDLIAVMEISFLLEIHFVHIQESVFRVFAISIVIFIVPRFPPMVAVETKFVHGFAFFLNTLAYDIKNILWGLKNILMA